MLNKDMRTAVLIDGQSIYYSTIKLGTPPINFKMLRDYFSENSNLMNVFYYNIFPRGERTSLHKVVDYLFHNGYVCKVPSVDFKEDSDSRRRPSTSVSSLVCNAMDLLCNSANMEQVVLLGHSPAYGPLMEELQLSGKRTVLVGTRKSDPPKVPLSLLSVSGNFLELWDLPIWEKDAVSDESSETE